MKQAYTMADYIDKIVKMYCDQCGRKYENCGNFLYERYGDANMPHFLKVMAAEMGCQIAPDEAYHRQCRMVYDIPDRLLEVASPLEFTPATPIGNLPEYVLLTAKCRHCDKMKRIDRWEVQRRLGSSTRLRDIMQRLKCSACGQKGPGILFSKMER